jgi:hypothetical protein
VLLSRSRSNLLVFHRLQLGGHIGLLLLQQCLALPLPTLPSLCERGGMLYPYRSESGSRPP